MTADDIALTLQPRLGPRAIAHLLSHMGSAGAIFGATDEELVTRCGLNAQIAADILRKRYHRQAEKELIYMERNGIAGLASTDEAYPARLRECGDHPHVLYYMGDCTQFSAPMLSVVGTRRMTAYGQRACDKIIGELAGIAPELVIVSGLAYGIDGASHRAALNNNLRTIGVLAHKLTEISPVQHTTLAKEMLRSGGALLSEYHSEANPGGNGFVPRNRIIAGISCATLVVESPFRGGAMITAGLADGYDRSVMAVPGRLDDPMSEGTNYLIKSNRARLAVSAEDIVREMMWDIEPAAKSESVKSDILSKESRVLLSLFDDCEVLSHDALLEKSGMTVTELAPLLLELEFEGFVTQLPGKMFEKV